MARSKETYRSSRRQFWRYSRLTAKAEGRPVPSWTDISAYFASRYVTIQLGIPYRGHRQVTSRGKTYRKAA